MLHSGLPRLITLQAPDQLRSHDLLLRLNGEHRLEGGKWHEEPPSHPNNRKLSAMRSLIGRLLSETEAPSGLYDRDGEGLPDPSGFVKVAVMLILIVVYGQTNPIGG